MPCTMASERLIRSVPLSTIGLVGASEPLAPPLPNRNVPPEIVVAPEYEFAPLRVTVPPETVRLPAPLMTFGISPVVLRVQVAPEEMAMPLASPRVRAALWRALLAVMEYPVAEVRLIVPAPALIVRPPKTTIPTALIV